MPFIAAKKAGVPLYELWGGSFRSRIELIGIIERQEPEGLDLSEQIVFSLLRDDIDADITRFLKKGWSLQRISRTSLAILRLAIYEIKYIDSIPDSVSVNEAVELAKKYTIDESGFVNGILGSFIRSREGDAE